MDDKPTIDTQGGVVIQGDLDVDGDFIGRDKITIFPGLTQRQTILLFTVLFGVLIVVIITTYPYIRRLFVVLPPSPKLTSLSPVPSTQGLNVTSLAVQGEKLWFGAQYNNTYRLYELDINAIDRTEPLPVVEVDAYIHALSVDCQGNVWLLMIDVGTRMYDPLTGRLSLLLNRNSIDSTLTKNTMSAVAFRCWDDGYTEVWLGRENVHTLSYDTTVGVSSLTFVPLEKDLVFEETQDLFDIRGLIYESDRLLVVDGSGVMREISPDAMFSTQNVDLKIRPLSVSQNAGHADLWFGSTSSITKLAEGGQPIRINIADSNQQPLDLRALLMAVDNMYVWISDVGTTCSVDDKQCCTLGFHIIGMDTVQCFTAKIISPQALLLDDKQRLWIGSARGLFVYAK